MPVWVGLQLYFPSMAAFPHFKSTAVTISQLPSPYTSNKLSSSLSKLMTSLICTQAGNWHFTLSEQPPCICSNFLCFSLLILTNRSLLSKINSYFQCTPVIICLLSPAWSTFLFLMGSPNQHETFPVKQQPQQYKTPKPSF